ncbi:MAG: CotH kinase family protein [Thermoguttaceae bacterium]
MKNILTGADTGATLTITENGVGLDTKSSPPAAGTDAYNTFNGYVDFSGGADTSLEISGNDQYTHTFAGLDTGDQLTYRFTGTSIRGNSGYDNRWTLVTLAGADSSVTAPGSGDGLIVLSPTEIAIMAGANHEVNQGWVAAWTHIDPGPDGQFSVVSTHHFGAVPDGQSSNGNKSYALTAVKLEAVPAGPLSGLKRIGNAEGQTAADFVRTDLPSKGEQNLGLTAPFGEVFPVTTGLGFSADQPTFESNIQTDVGRTMQGVNASLFGRIEFTVDDLTLFDRLTLRMKYDDGFVAYLNGTEVARRNAPDPEDPLLIDSAATATHADAEAVVFEDIDITDDLVSLNVGTNVLAIHGLNYKATDGDFLLVPELVARSSFGDQQYMVSPTPGLENIDGAIGFVADTKFSVDRGFYDTPQQVEVRSATPMATIRYTLDGSAPTATTGIVYTGPIAVDTTTILRAAAYRAGYEPSNVDTHTYVFVADVIGQSSTPDGFPSLWRSEPADYEMDPQIVGNPLYGDTLEEDLKSLPVMSLVMDGDDLFDAQNGIYANSNNQGFNWERGGSLEMFDPNDPSAGFQVNAGVRMYGGVGRNARYKKHSFRILFKGMYGPTKLRYPLFGEEAVDQFDTIILRSNFNDAWVWGGAATQFIRDEFAGRLNQAMGDPARHGTFVHLYVNGLYWGLYNPVERPDTSFSASYYGGDKDNWDGINSGSPTGESTTVSWNALMNLAGAGLSTNDNYQKVQGNNINGTRNPAYENLLDVDQYINYLLMNFWAGNNDWISHNWYAGRERGPESTGFKAYTWDAEWIVHMRSSVTENSVNDTPTNNYLLKPYTTLRNNAEFKLRFADHVHKHMFNGGVLTPSATSALYASLADEIQRAVVAESARWGDAVTRAPFTLQHWINERDYILGTYMSQRYGNVLQQLKNAGLYPNITAPSFRLNGFYKHGGQIDPGDELTLDAPTGTIYYTIDGTDPRALYGAVSATAQVFGAGSPIMLGESSLVKSRVRSGSVWSALNEAEFFLHQRASDLNLAITELNYNPSAPTDDEWVVDPTFGNDDFEFIELQNIGTEIIDLRGVRFTSGITFEFTDPAASLAPGDRVVLARDMAAFATRYPGVTPAGYYDGALDNGGEQITLLNRIGTTIVDFAYNDKNAWPGRADGSGASLELIDPTAVPTTQPARVEYLQDGDHWRGSSEYGGSPGLQGIGPITDVLVNEVLTHTDNGTLDAIELVNTTEEDINIGGWYLSDSNNNYAKYRIPDGTMLFNGGYLVFDEEDFNPSGGVDSELHPNDFALSGAHGDDVWLMKATVDGKLTHFVDHVEFPAARLDESFGRWPNAEGRLYPMTEKTLDGDNAVEKQWLKVTVLSTANTGLTDPDVFYFGNTLGEAGDQALNTIVNATDEIAARNFQHGAVNPAAADDPYDYNRDGWVDGTDQIIARNNQTNPLTMLRLISIPAMDAVLQQSLSSLPADVDWLYEWEQTNLKKRSSGPQDSTATIVDELLALRWGV